MCKLAASVNLEPKSLSTLDKNKINKILEHLFYVNSFGQTDGSGVMTMQSFGETVYHKRAVPSPDFINTKWFQDTKDSLADSFAVGMHTRYSTVGGNSDLNSHPFEHGKYLLMQNGTIGRSCGHKSLISYNKEDQSPCAVDSESVCWAMNKQGIDKTFDRYEGAGVFMFFDTESNTFNIVKNDERTLYMAKVKGKDIFIFATEFDSLMLAFTRAGVAYDEIVPVVDDLLHTWHFAKGYSNRPLVVKGEWSSYMVPSVTPKVKGNQAVGKSQELSEVIPALLCDNSEYCVDDCAVCSSPIMSNETYYYVNNSQGLCCCEDCHDVAIESFGVQLTEIQPEVCAC